jgi:mono/diheme cytochrome c family protein
MITPLMSRPVKVLQMMIGAIAVTAFATACGTERISVAQDNPNYHGAQLFNQRCSGCHTLSYAATHGSATNVRTREIVNGPNFNVRCERPVTRVLYAIQNGGFSGAIMPQNIVVGQDATDVAKFVATYAGHQAKVSPATIACQQQPVGTIPAATATATTAAATTPSTNTTATSSSTTTTPASTAGKANSGNGKGNSGNGNGQGAKGKNQSKKSTHG